jgi:hypothetical protein
MGLPLWLSFEDISRLIAVPQNDQGPLEVCPSSPGVRQSAPVWCTGNARVSWSHRSRTQPLQPGMQAVMHDITALLAMMMRQPKPNPC